MQNEDIKKCFPHFLPFYFLIQPVSVHLRTPVPLYVLSKHTFASTPHYNLWLWIDVIGSLILVTFVVECRKSVPFTFVVIILAFHRIYTLKKNVTHFNRYILFHPILWTLCNTPPNASSTRKKKWKMQKIWRVFHICISTRTSARFLFSFCIHKLHKTNPPIDCSWTVNLNISWFRAH